MQVLRTSQSRRGQWSTQPVSILLVRELQLGEPDRPPRLALASRLRSLNSLPKFFKSQNTAHHTSFLLYPIYSRSKDVAFSLYHALGITVNKTDDNLCPYRTYTRVGGYFNNTAMAAHSSTLAWKIPWTEEPGGLQAMGSLRVGHDWATSLSLFTSMHWRRKWQPTPVFLPGESQGRGNLVGCRLWGHTESNTTKVT